MYWFLRLYLRFIIFFSITVDFATLQCFVFYKTYFSSVQSVLYSAMTEKRMTTGLVLSFYNGHYFQPGTLTPILASSMGSWQENLSFHARATLSRTLTLIVSHFSDTQIEPVLIKRKRLTRKGGITVYEQESAVAYVPLLFLILTVWIGRISDHSHPGDLRRSQRRSVAP